VDGNNHQIDRINAQAENRKAKVATVVDLIHVMECIWGDAWCFFCRGRPSRRGLDCFVLAGVCRLGGALDVFNCSDATLRSHVLTFET
jgi:hypothetical protein